MSQAALFNAHIEHLKGNYQRAIAAAAVGCDAVLLHSGSEAAYFADDRHIPFQAWGHFLHWLPVNRPDQMLLIVPGEKPIYFQVVRPDFWYEQDAGTQSWWADAFTIQRLADPAEAAPLLAKHGRIAFLGENTAFARAMGLDPSLFNPQALLHWLDYQRASKTDYEVAQLAEANCIAMGGHLAAEQAFREGASEYGIHQAFLQACNILEEESPYTNIVALNEKAAILHYQNKRRAAYGQRWDGSDNRVLLIDAGVRVNSYGSDITRTHTREQTHAVFRSLVSAVEALQQDLIGLIMIGRPFLDLHVAAHEGICEILLRHDILKGDYEEVFSKGLSSLFFPHGLGHLLGIQVHDVGGRQANAQGDTLPPPTEYPALRTTRVLEAGQVFTMEPGLYFIPSLLDPARASEAGQFINWTLVDELLPCGGIRIEDNVLLTEQGVRNLTRG